MVRLAADEIAALTGIAQVPTEPDEPQIDHVDIAAHEIKDEIQDVLVYITLKVSETEGWDQKTGNEIRRRVFEALNQELASRHPDGSYAVTTFLRPRMDQDA